MRLLYQGHVFNDNIMSLIMIHMKRKTLFVAAALTVLASVGLTVASANHSSLSDVQLANIEALSRGEAGMIIPCWSKSELNYKKSYVDCSRCERIEGYQAEGPEAGCRTHS